MWVCASDEQSIDHEGELRQQKPMHKSHFIQWLSLNAPMKFLSVDCPKWLIFRLCTNVVIHRTDALFHRSLIASNAFKFFHAAVLQFHSCAEHRNRWLQSKLKWKIAKIDEQREHVMNAHRPNGIIDVSIAFDQSNNPFDNCFLCARIYFLIDFRLLYIIRQYFFSLLFLFVVFYASLFRFVVNSLRLPLLLLLLVSSLVVINRSLIENDERFGAFCSFRFERPMRIKQSTNQ